ncbi:MULTISPECIES: cbb3-type cytochrome oxidase assembly protein CcoS [Gammaproteobacteria]|uniref:Cbb3-type cytochrome oxidase assembly protein CcoS n=1 Tax=Vreelandella halophila TaxID=86177 RepID=A0A9X4YBY0_9GAMM|nr:MULTISPECIES: cbb3-type cytochrome oxidase assembly protein CcoS [Gammaproteobacteria]KAA8984376.1 cbb3-type cytochrome oxidase assembly protein CcoS [Halospina sp. K52047b]MYL26899.1 cbb3-type cytochrome oxidase assembly protein CcoS [Halomonas utahensis]MYL74160.1 cbb3-type cytochrome oxidase assembly protein CcoS [Halomonas sp. 22501_18_FS]
MAILYILIPLSLILLAIAVRVLIWAVRNDQFDDLEGPAHQILFDDDEDRIPPEARQHTEQTSRQREGSDPE